MEKKVKASIKALLLTKKKMKKEVLLDHDEMKIFLQISAIKVAPGALKQTIKLPLPAPFHGSSGVCLFVKDLQRGIRVDHDKSATHWSEVLQDAGVTRITEVMPLRQVKAEYSMYEARRKLCDAHDLFLTDVRIARLLPSLLGKHFIAKKKQPVSINMEAKDLVKEIDAALGATYLHIYNKGDSSAVQVGQCGQAEEELCRNVMAVIDTLERKFPGGLRNIRTLGLKLNKSPSLPIFVSNVRASGVPVPAARHEPGSRREPVSGELSTARAESDVIVDRFGAVQVVQKRPLSDDEELTDEEEEKTIRGKGRKRQAKKPVESAAEPSPTSAAAAADGPDRFENKAATGGDSSDDDEHELEERERRFLDELASQRAAGRPQEADRQTGKGDVQIAKSAKTKKNQKIVEKDKQAAKKVLSKKEKADLKAIVADNSGNKAGEAKLSGQAMPAKSYSKRKSRNVGKVKKVK